MHISQEDREIGIKNYEVASQLLNARAQLRDNALLAYLTASVTLFGLVIGKSLSPLVLLIIPYLAVGVSIIISHHNLLIGSLLDFLNQDESKIKPRNFYSSEPFKKYIKISLLLRTGGHLIIILMPCIGAIIINWKYAFNFSSSIDFIWWFAVIFTSLAIIIHTWIFFERKKNTKSKKILIL